MAGLVDAAAADIGIVNAAWWNGAAKNTALFEGASVLVIPKHHAKTDFASCTFSPPARPADNALIALR